MVIRDWDRAFPTTSSSLELISDFGNGFDSSGQELRLQDAVTSSEEVPGDIGYGNSYNDYYDWDDIVPMSRTPLAPGSSAVWEPTNGWFDPDSFPNLIKP